ncbi:MAG: protein phosphatase 2C domain-containing protein [Desulfovibrio sp.]|nr:protein phosphatase 2C domain-containing protein [Desulfovibrio sp.]
MTAQMKHYIGSLDQSRNKVKAEVDAWPNPLSNGRKGQFYECSFTLPPIIKGAIFKVSENLGLEIKRNNLTGQVTISGDPAQAGDFKIRMYYAWSELMKKPVADVLKNQLLRELDITIFPDPKELWNDIATPSNIEYYKEDKTSSIIHDHNLTLTGASVRGRSHAHTGLPRDDDFAMAIANGWYILAAADGAGSAQFSRAGSKIACDRVIRVCDNYLNGDNDLTRVLARVAPETPKTDWLPAAKRAAYALLPHAVFEAWKEIKAEAQKKGREAREYATTFLLAVCRRFEAGWFIVSFQVGDGAMGLISGDKAILLAEPDEGDYGGQTRFITMQEIYKSEELMRRLNIALVPGLDALILMTDGVSDAKFSAPANLRDKTYWLELWTELAPLVNSPDPGRELADWLGFWSQGNHDDRTIVILSENQPIVI